MVDIKLFLDTSKVNKKGLAPLSLTAQFRGKTIKVPSGISLAPEHFSPAHQTIVQKTPNAKAIRERIAELNLQMKTALMHFEKAGAVPSGAEVKARMQMQFRKQEGLDQSGQPITEECVVPFFAVFQSISERRRKQSYLNTFNQVEFHFTTFSPTLRWEQLTEKTLDEYVDYLIDVELSNATIHNHIKNLKVLAGEARKQGHSVPTAIDDYRFAGDRCRPICLTKQELAKLIEVNPEVGSAPWKAWVRWLFRCYTSLRISECNGLTAKNFYRENGELVVRYTSHKTKKENILPISANCEALLESCGYRIPDMARQGESDYMKKLCKQAGIKETIVRVRHIGINRREETFEKWQLISSHTSRRTFGKRFIEEGGSLFDLQIIYQHDNIKTTAEYIDMTISDLLKTSKSVMNRI